MNIDVRLLEYGIFAQDQMSVSKVFDFQSPKEYFFELQGNSMVTKQTDKIPLQQGIVFGIKFEIQHSAPDPFSVFIRILHPELENPENNFTFSETSQHKVVQGNKVYAEAYVLENKWELVPGFWSFQVEYGSEIVLVKEFELYVSETAAEQEEEVYFYDM